ncbi:MAG: hypothetical protein ABIE55_01340 [Candidatus Aenigmatarchaeota archaeon]
MNYKEINWSELRKKSMQWKPTLNKLTRELLTSSDKAELSKYNNDGYFHYVRIIEENNNSTEIFEKMKMFWEKEKRVPEEWISIRSLPGIWTAMFSPENTYSSAQPPIHILRFYFKDGFFVYDNENPRHRKISKSWKTGGRKNPWKNSENIHGNSMEKRMKGNKYPSHKCFYEDNSIGAIIGYHDYISPVIVLEDSVEKVEFLRNFKI